MHANLLNYFIQTSLSIKLTLLFLLSSSVITWVIIVQRSLLLRQLDKAYTQFENQFWSGIRLTELYDALPESIPEEHLSSIFHAGFTEFCRLRNSGCQTLSVILDAVSRAMRIAQAQAEVSLERHLNWLSIIGSSAPYFGLLGTIFGVMSALNALGNAGQVNAWLLIAPGVADALIVTVVSLVTAIPAIMFYHRYLHQMECLLNQYHIFQDEFIALLVRQAYEEHHENLPYA
jgi:biopolymer transport protein TolQ